MEVEAGFTLCYNPNIGYVPCYSDYFEVYIYPGKYILHKENFTSYFKPFYNITINTFTTTTLIRTTQTFLFLSQYYSQGMTFAFRSRGACGKIFRIKMYYYYCEETFNKGIKFKRTSSPAKGSKYVTGNCSENSLPSNNITSVHRYCYPNGTWNRFKNANLQCFCVEGYEPITDGSCASEFHTCRYMHLRWRHTINSKESFLSRVVSPATLHKESFLLGRRVILNEEWLWS